MMSQVQVLLRPPQYTSPERDPTGGFLCSNEHCMIARRICEFVSQTAGMQIGRGQIAQSVEQRTENPCVPSSNLGLATTISHALRAAIGAHSSVLLAVKPT